MKIKIFCQKNGKTIFYFEWLFDLYGYECSKYYHCDVEKYILSKNYGYAHLTEKHIKKLNFSGIEIYVEHNLIDSNDIICTDLDDTQYYSIYTIMLAHCYFIYNGEQQPSYNAQFYLFDYNYLSFVTYDNKYLSDEDSWRRSTSMSFYNSTNSDFCNTMKDPFQERISCIEKINNCMYCENENICIKCNYGFSIVDGQCQSSIDYKNNLKYFTPDNGTNYYTCSSKINNCEECTYDDFSFNKFHCTKYFKELNLNETYKYDSAFLDNKSEESLETDLSGKASGNFIGSFTYISLLLLTILI